MRNTMGGRDSPNRPKRAERIVLEALAICSILVLAISCAGITPPSAPRTESPSASVQKKAIAEVAGLPPEARSFMVELRDNIRRGDWTWAADHADASFLRAMEGHGQDPYFYTCLFSAGSLSEETADDYGRFKVLPMAKVRDMTWDEARIDGPVAVVRGRFILASGDSVPFTLRILVRLEPPRILGYQP